uniref:Hydrophobin n=1 Tax=Bionectria ochroleuca TaxID=29856 RepID=A0A8H7TTX6_BIOOC
MLNCGLTSSLARASSLALLWSIIPAASSHAIPLKTHTVELRELNVLLWPLPTVMPEANHLLGRQLNTVCGYVGGNPDLPATCSAGSHCAIDVEHGVVGCCPDGGPCTQGVYTGCVDGNSDPQTEINPYVYTCGGGNVCYQNQFDGGYHQYGCGSASDLATTVAMSASGKQTLDLTSISLEFTATATSLSEPTTLGTKSSSKSDSSTTSSLKTTSSKTSSTGTTGTTGTTGSSSDSNPTSTGGANGGDGDKDNANDEAPKDSNNSPPLVP